ncbi:uncharacterized protein LOC109862871 [Pseudomyrmex gracilis]|uniref:uncharacterized protein LOC109862871 n=1 Tax=Pseudomyrmex gracilis TaxID=219809 RepID=UPI0009954E53|nr:uncharacterized protein LOC109862871 [Pseudomyrmex gracilis]
MYKNREYLSTDYLHSNKENINNDDETYCVASSKCKEISTSSSAKRYQPSLSTTYSKDMKKPKLMATAVNLLEKKSSMFENLKQKMLELNQETLKLKKEELAVHKGILEELQNLNNGLTAIREVMLGQYLDP